MMVVVEAKVKVVKENLENALSETRRTRPMTRMIVQQLACEQSGCSSSLSVSFASSFDPFCVAPRQAPKPVHTYSIICGMFRSAHCTVDTVC